MSYENDYFPMETRLIFPQKPYCKTQKTMNTWKISGMLIV